MSESNTTHTPVLLVGVCLVSDGTAEQLSPLGAVTVSSGISADNLSVLRLRQLIVEQIPSCPPSFRFFTSQRYCGLKGQNLEDTEL